MSRPCTVCTHPKRAEIDGRLALQVVNLRELSKMYGLGREAVRSHRAKHLPGFLPALVAQAQVLPLSTIQAEAQRLYLVALDALARAEAGTLAHVAEDGSAVYNVSSTAVARLLRESRSALDMLARLAVAGAEPSGTPKGQPNAELDDRIADALDRLTHRETLDISDAVEVPVQEAMAGGGPPVSRLALSPPPDLVSADRAVPRANELPLTRETPTQWIVDCPRTHQACEQACRGLCQLDATSVVPKASIPEDDLAERAWAFIRDTAKSRGDVLPQHASREEMKQMGYDLSAAIRLLREQDQGR